MLRLVASSSPTHLGDRLYSSGFTAVERNVLSNQMCSTSWALLHKTAIKFPSMRPPALHASLPHFAKSVAYTGRP